MTTVIKTETVNGHYIEINQDKYSTAYRVIYGKDYGNGYASCPYDERYYGDLPKANRRFRDLKRKLRGE